MFKIVRQFGADYFNFEFSASRKLVYFIAVSRSAAKPRFRHFQKLKFLKMSEIKDCLKCSANLARTILTSTFLLRENSFILLPFIAPLRNRVFGDAKSGMRVRPLTALTDARRVI